MKKVIYLMLLILMVGVTADAKKKPKPVIKYSLEVTNMNERSEKGKLISFDCWNASEYSTTFIRGFQVKNDTDERVFIEWENARVTNSRVIFGDDRRITMGNPKADEAISPHGRSISREITGETYIGSSWVLDLYDTKQLKKNLGSKDTTYIKIPIRFADGSVEEYELKYIVWYEMPTAE